MATFARGSFGSGQRLSATGFLVLGLLTFWIYSTLRFAAALRHHFARRWREIEARSDMKDADPAKLAALRERGYEAGRALPLAAAALFAASAIVVAWWFCRWIFFGDIAQYATIVGAVGASSALFYLGTLVLTIWALRTVRNHEIAELLVHEAGTAALLAEAPDLGEDIARRWEQVSNQVALFLIVAAPMVFSPTVGAHLFFQGTVWGDELVLPGICFLLAAAFHVWGTVLLVGLYNGHLAEETQHAAEVHAVGSLRPVDAAKDADGAPERALVAIMLTDMQGYSKAMERDEAGAFARLQEHNAIMRGAIQAHRGREIKTIGDAFLVVFRSAMDAVDCALAAQRAFGDYNQAKAEDARIMVRIGIHLGDVILTRNDVYGDGVNVAARIEPLAVPGGICVSEPVFEMVKKKLQLDVQEVQGAKLKNISVAPRLYRITMPA